MNCIFTVLLSLAMSSALDDHHWEAFKLQHGKNYTSQIEEFRRRTTFAKSRQLVQEHNEAAATGTHSYNLTLNHLADVDRRRLHLARGLSGLLVSKHKPSELHHVPEAAEGSTPEELDWRQKGFKMRALNQEECGSCYAFTVASAMEAQVFKKNGTLMELSEQQLVDCSVLYGNLGCMGGSLRNTAKYLEKYHLLSRNKYPYKGKLSICRPQTLAKKDGVRLKKWGVLPLGDEEALKRAVARVGPVAVSINAEPDTFQLYHSGVYDDSSCDDSSLNHAMLLVGYTKDAWILQNWWTSRWGQDGYMYLKRGVNRCGVAAYAVYVTI